MNELTYCEIETLREDGEFVVSRVRRGNGHPSWLLVSLGAEQPVPASLVRLQRAHALRDDLDPSWASRPLEVVRHLGKPALLLHDPGGDLLESLLGRPMGVTGFLRIAIGIVNALSKMHARGLVHKEVKPANLFVKADTGEAWLTGFGLASRLPRQRQAPEPPEVIAGTLAYMAPEQTGRMNRSIDSRSDLYSMGVTFYEMIAGSLPFAASDPMEWVHCHIARMAQTPHARVSDIPEQISAIIMKLLAKAPEERYQTAAGVEADLRGCLAAWEIHKRIEPFPLGAHDVSGRLLIPETLYGREREIELLLGTFERVARQGKTEFVLVSGYSGVGKSSVVNELRNVLVPPRGFFASGKFDQYKRDVPYATIAQAFEGIVRQILIQSDSEVAGWRNALCAALDSNGQLIVNLIPEIEMITGKFPPVPEFPPQDAKNRLQMVFRKFLGVFARPEHPLALFLDDLQWLDMATLELLKHLVTEPEVRHVLLVGAYRENEVSASHPLTRTLEEIRRAGAAVREIVLGPLSIENVEKLVLDTLHCPAHAYQPLAQLMHEKTGGNPFFAIQFLTTLAQEGLLAFDRSAAAWSWDVPRIHAQGFTDNVADLMAGKLDRLPDATQETLRQLACLGNCADPSIVSIVLRDTEETRSALWEAVRAGLIFELDGTYAFIHDRVQEAAYALIPEDRRAPLHLRIGRLLVGTMTPRHIQEKIFDVTNQLNSGRALISDLNEKDLVAELNLRAGRKAKSSAAYASACFYLSAGMELVGCNAWERRYELAFGLWLERAESAYLNGNFDEAEGLVGELLGRAAAKVDKVAAYRLKILLHLMRAEYQQAVDRGLECLRIFGIEMPAHPTRDQVQIEYEMICQNLGDRSIESLIDLPFMTDPEMQAAMGVLSVIPAPAFHTDIDLLYLVFCQMVNASLKYGTTGASAHGYAELATILGPIFHRYLDGYRFGKLACSLVEKYGFDAYKAKAFFCMERAMLWTRPINSAIDFIRLAFDAGIETHDLSYACFSCCHLVTGLLMQGAHLDEVWSESQKGLAFIRKVRFRDLISILLSQQRFILNMRGETDTFSSFSDSQFDEETFEAQLAADRIPHLSCHYWILKLQARFISGDYDAAIRAAQKAKGLLWSAEQHIQSVDYYYYSALTATALYEIAGAAMRSEVLETVEQSLKWLREWAESCPGTFLDKYTLVLAELARIEGRELDAMRLYEEAIRAARDNGFVQNEGIANELAAKFYRDRRYETIAQAYLRNARYCYLCWGALGKVRQIDLCYPQLHKESRLRIPSATIGASVEQLDFEAVVKASQALSGEMVLPHLIEKLLRIALEHAGADRTVLIHVQEGEPKVEAEAATGGDAVTVRGQLAATSTEFPESILRYVIRSQDSVILDDALTPNRFSADNYLRRELPRSVLCLPLVKQTQLTGALYLENRLTPHVFTPARLTVLRLLASQAAISLENARLYADLQRENVERKHAEEEMQRQKAHLNELFELAPEAIVLTDINARVIRVNREFTKLFGYTPEEGVERDLGELIVPEEMRDDFEKKRELITAGEAIDAETVRKRKDGKTLIVSVVAAQVPLPGDQIGVYTIYRDITERRRAEEELRRSEASLRKVQGELAHVTRVTTMGELTASIAHEVNQPIAGMVINGNAGLRWLARLKEDSANLDGAREALQRIIRDGKRVGDIIARIRALFRNTEAAKELLDLNETIREVVVLIRNEMDKMRIVLRLELATQLPRVVGDRVQLQQVILNLILNAIEAMSTVEGRLRELSVGTRTQGGAEVKVTVGDSGPGIDPDRMEQIFAAFHTTKPGGLGMGLSISRSIVENHGGRLWATGNEGPGVTFQFTLLTHTS